MAHSVLAIGNWVIRHHTEKYGCGVTLMHLNKLLYLIDGWSMAILGSSIIEESPRCGRLCPYYEEIMNHLSFEGSHEINFNIVDWATEEPFSCPLEGKEFDLIDDVLSAYAGLSPMTLSAHLTRVGTPFHTTKVSHRKRNNEGLLLENYLLTLVVLCWYNILIEYEKEIIG